MMMHSSQNQVKDDNNHTQLQGCCDPFMPTMIQAGIRRCNVMCVVMTKHHHKQYRGCNNSWLPHTSVLLAVLNALHTMQPPHTPESTSAPVQCNLEKMQSKLKLPLHPVSHHDSATASHTHVSHYVEDAYTQHTTKNYTIPANPGVTSLLPSARGSQQT
jgi:hypothetical protein